MKEMKQQCFLWSVWLTWLGLPILAIAMGLYLSWWAGVFVLVAGVAAQVFYIRIFPQISRAMGYGSVENVTAAPPSRAKSALNVTLYTANVCPFCPIIKQRLAELQRDMGFIFQEVDITFRPDLMKTKGFRSVPVVEADGKYWVGNATSAQLVAFLTDNS